MIAVLLPHVIYQSAAGVVIERPASVVKELVDNAVDAGARTITVECTAGGRSLIRVCDDGRGMSPQDAVLAFERHATSKLREVDDLWGIASMGFRGEALPSIASVSRLTLVTRQAGALAGTRVEFEGGKLVGVTEVGAPVGTSVEVADLLFNLPARQKFLKGDSTEASHVTDLVGKVALAHPELHLKLKHNGRTALDVPPDRDGFARAQALLGARTSSRMVPVSGEESGIRVTAYLGAPELAQATARGVQLFVGRRAVRDRGILHAVSMGYGELVPRGRYPIAIVLLDVPAGTVDVNVHPQKLEVRFSDAAAVCGAVRHIVQTGVGAASWRSELGAGPMQMTAIASVAPPALPFDNHSATPLAQRYARELRERTAASQASLAFDPPAPTSSARAWVAQVREHTRPRAPEPFALRVEPAPRASEPSTPDLADGSGPVAGPAYFGRLRYLGQLDLTYLVCETHGELVLVDQHSAHERVELARLQARGDQDVAVQKLLFPVTIDATPVQLALIARVGDLLARVGYEAEAFGKATIAIKAVPARIRHGDPAQLLRRLLDEWARDDDDIDDDERLDRILAEIACHSVVRAGDRLGSGEAEALLRALDDVDPTSPPPHGRSLLLRLPLAEIGRRFGR
ncbi:MAG: DNA mismatch repair endonuclease MutL [Kofleriaceae bacterium]